MRIELWTDGSGLGVDPVTAGAPGAWAYTLVALDDDGTVLRQRGAVGAALRTSSNRMELTAVLEGLRAVREATRLTVFSDSQYVVHGFSKCWVEKWKRRGWFDVKNVDLWRALCHEVDSRKVTFKWVPGHAGVAYNELVHADADSTRRALLEALENGDGDPDIATCGFPVVDGAPPPAPKQESLLGVGS